MKPFLNSFAFAPLPKRSHITQGSMRFKPYVGSTYLCLLDYKIIAEKFRISFWDGKYVWLLFLVQEIVSLIKINVCIGAEDK